MTQQINEEQLLQMVRQEEATLNDRQDFYAQLQGAAIDLVKTTESLKEIQKKPGKIMFKIGGGVLIEAEITNTETCKKAFSEKGYKKEKITDTITWLNKRATAVEEQMRKVQIEITESQQRYSQLISIMKQVDSQIRKSIATK